MKSTSLFGFSAILSPHSDFIVE